MPEVGRPLTELYHCQVFLDILIHEHVWLIWLRDFYVYIIFSLMFVHVEPEVLDMSKFLLFFKYFGCLS